jgi:hypothetical protein
VQGFAAITANNGWAMAGTGASIVIIGLVSLAFIISQLHKIVALLEKKKKPLDQAEVAGVPAADLAAAEAGVLTDLAAAEAGVLTDLAAAARAYQPLAANLGERFTLSELYQVLAAANVPHPHITVREFRGAGYLIPTGEGFFSWNNI